MLDKSASTGYNTAAMTTLIIHPEIEIQKKSALDLAGEYLDLSSFKDANLLELQHPDLHLIDGTIVTSIGIDDVRELIRRLQYQPYQSSAQVGLIIMANMLTEQAQNSLLKTLEEPTSQTQFILTTPHEKYLLPTILSRSQKLFVREKIATTASRITKPDTTQSADTFLKLDLVDRFLYIETLVKQDKETPGAIDDFLGDLLEHYRIELLHATREKNSDEASVFSQKIRNINRARHFINKNANKRLTLENLILQLEKSIM